MRICLILESSYPYVHGGVSSVGELEVIHRPHIDDVQPPERKEVVDFDSFTKGGIAHDQCWIGHIQVSFGADEAHLARSRISRR